jgi:hypothetical protein
MAVVGGINENVLQGFALCYEFREAQEIEASCVIELIHLPKKGRCSWHRKGYYNV